MFSVNRIKQQLIFWGPLLIGENKVKIGLEYRLTTILPSKSCIPKNTLVLAYFTTPNWNQLSSNFFFWSSYAYFSGHQYVSFLLLLWWYSFVLFLHFLYLKVDNQRKILFFISKCNMIGIYFKCTLELESQRSMKL